MEAIAWNTLLFVLKWVFIGLIYLSLFALLVVVRREAALHIGGKQSVAYTIPGRLKVIARGNDPKIRIGAMINLRTETRLGTGQDNDVVLGDKFVSRYHARLQWDGISWWIEDLGSKNGTFVDNTRCLPKIPQPVTTGATISIGGMSFQLQE
jgi:pSer/pThr/pTyr-binding forkhead associated (FHA) protein